MAKKNICPDRIKIQGWLDSARADETVAAHVAGCRCCRELAEKIEAENLLIKATLESLPPMPDLSEKIMLQVMALASPVKNRPYQALALLFILSSSLGLLLLFHGITGFFSSVSWSVAFIKFMSFAASFIMYSSIIIDYILGWIFSAQPLVPSLSVTVAVILINWLQKRRLYNA